jgi:catalase
MLRDGFHQHAVHSGAAPYKPNSLDAGCPFFAGTADGAFVDVPVRVPETKKVRANPVSFDDHFSQARVFWQSMSAVEKEHIIRAYTFELGKCYEQGIKERQLQCLANIDPVLCAEVATGLGLPAPEPTVPLAEVTASPALSQVGRAWPPDGRMVGIIVDPDGDLDGLRLLRETVFGAGMVPLMIAPRGGMVDGMPAQRTFSTGRSVEYDVLLLGGSPGPAPDALPARDAKAGADATVGLDPRVQLMVEECWRHAKVIGAWGEGVTALDRLGVTGSPGIVTGADAATVFEQVQDQMAGHRVWERFPAGVA